ncbi:MAG: T9SS type A sorting domain-containing protein [Ignavibacteriaceae bacterium]
MRSLILVFFVYSLFFLFLPTLHAQTFDGEWSCDYATIDDQPNATGYNTAAVGVIKPNTFVALVTSDGFCYLVGYTNADSVNGRMGYYPYGSDGLYTVWASGFDNVQMVEAYDLATSKDSLVYVANNDIEKNILVFRMSADSVISTDNRMVTGTDSIFAIDVDALGRVFVTQRGTNLTDGKVLIFNNIGGDPAWGGTHASSPLAEITVPGANDLRGITVNNEGTVIYVSDYTTKKVYCYTGNPSAGYTRYNGFDFTLTDKPIANNNIDTIYPGPIGLKFMATKNILMVACAQIFRLGVGYQYSRVYFLNPNTGAILDTIDAAAWNFSQTGGFSTRPQGTFGTASGYASLYSCGYDDNFDVYSVSYYGWTVDKWSFSGTIPVVPLTILSLEKNEDVIPSDFSLSQNYPNPFNPNTTIEFGITENSVVNLEIYNVNGELVTELIKSSIMEKGSYRISFDASKLSSGTYIYTLRVGERQLTRKMTLVK